MRARHIHLALVLGAVAFDATAAGCRVYSNRLAYTGKLGVGESRVVVEWRTPCDGAVNASAAVGRLSLLRQDGGEWQVVKEGISTIVPRLPAGTYRLIVSNPYGIPTDYKVSLKYGTG
jgi:hypothetical protein